MDKKKKILIILVFVIAMIVTACITLTIRNKKTEKYIIIDEDLYYNDKVFTRDDNNYSIIRLGKVDYPGKLFFLCIILSKN